MIEREPTLPQRGRASPSRLFLIATLAALVGAAVLVAGCGDSGPKAPAGGAAGAPPPAQVGVIEVQLQTIALSTELPGRVEPIRVAQVRARVNGVVLKRVFREGSEVKAGQTLFEIDAAPYRATLASAQAALARAEANRAQAAATAQRYKPLAEAKAISQQDYVNAQAAQKAAEADVAASKAAIRTAQISLDYARVTAPIRGRIGRALVTEGALVSATEATQLATIQQIDKVYVNFTQSSSEVLRLRQAMAAKQLERSGNGESLPVRILLDGGQVYGHEGKLLFSDLTVDESSGQITLRAEVPNPDGYLLPGQYVRVRLSQAQLPSGVLLPQQAVTRNSTGDTVLVVGDDNKPAPRPIKIGGEQRGQWIVTEGLQAGERVIVDGFQKMMVPGAPVNPVPWQPAAAGSAPGGAAAASAPASAAAR